MNNVKEKSRVFVYERREYADPGVQFSNEAVRDMLARTFGALAGGEIAVNEQDERTVVTFSPRPQRKGLGGSLIRECRMCSCTDEKGCPEGCWWVEDDLCSRCEPKAKALDEFTESLKAAAAILSQKICITSVEVKIERVSDEFYIDVDVFDPDDDYFVNRDFNDGSADR